MKHFFALTLFSIVVLVAFGADAQELPSQKMISFADHLFDQGDYYRAITEYERVIFFYPDQELAKKSRYQIALCYLKGNRATEAITRFRRLAEDYPAEEIGKRSLFMIGEAYSQKTDYQQAIDVFERFLNSYPQDPQRDEARVKIGWSYLRQGSWEQASEEFSKVSPESPLRGQAAGLAEESKKFPDIPVKSPYLAGGLSAVLPGAGQLYLGRPRDAGISFLLNGIFIWGTVEAFRNNNDVTGGILLFFESGWYLGNVYNAISGAHKYNRDARRDFLNRLSNQYAVSYYRTNQGDSLLALTVLF
jgi:outer membrane protein assembly factor BamD (BamD/ComL family)